jgi:hypothetical protein
MEALYSSETTFLPKSEGGNILEENIFEILLLFWISLFFLASYLKEK